MVQVKEMQFLSVQKDKEYRNYTSEIYRMLVNTIRSILFTSMPEFLHTNTLLHEDQTHKSQEKRIK